MITCPVCKMTSHNPNDEKYGYCGNCKEFTTPKPVPVYPDMPFSDPTEAEAYMRKLLRNE